MTLLTTQIILVVLACVSAGFIIFDTFIFSYLLKINKEVKHYELPLLWKKTLDQNRLANEKIETLEQKIKQSDALLRIHTEVFHDTSTMSTEPEENNVKEDEPKKHYVNIDAPYFSQNASVNIQMIDDNLRQLLSPDEYDGYTSVPANSGIGQLIDISFELYTLAKVKKLLNIFPDYTITFFNLSLCNKRLDITINYLNVLVRVSFFKISILSEKLSLLKGLLFALEKDNPEGSLVCK